MEYLKVKLGKICKTNQFSYSKKDNWNVINYLDTGNITQNVIDEIQELKVGIDTIPSRAKRKVKIDDIIYSTVRPNQLHYGIIKSMHQNLLVSTGFTVISVDKTKADADYIYYYLTQSHITESLHSIGEQSTSAYPSIKPSDLENLELDLPTLEIQKQIAFILCIIDEKMAVNSKLNENLGEFILLQHKKWFEDFILPNENIELVEYDREIIPKGWKIANLGEVMKNFDSKRKPLSSRQREERRGIYPYYGATSIMDYVNDYIFDDVYVLMGEDGSVIHEDGTPFLQYIWGKSWINNHAHVLKGIAFSTEILYCYLKKMNVSGIVTGAVQLKINQANMNSVKIIKAPSKIYEAFDRIAQPIFDKIRQISNENKRLVVLRDILLPRLMSGEIDLSELDL